jgi:hypothetical protein
MKRNAARARFEKMRRSEATSAPAAMPLTAARIGFFSWRMFFDIAGHSRKLVPLIVGHFKQRPDDVMHTTAGAKAFSRSRNHDPL